MMGKPNPNFVANKWNDYRERVMPADASRAQFVETRRAFYAGVLAFHLGLMNELAPGDEPTDDDMIQMDMIQRELDEFVMKVGTKQW